MRVDGEDSTSDGTPGIADTDGDYLFGGDSNSEFDARFLSLADELISEFEDLGLNRGTKSSVVGKLTGAVEQLD